MAGWQNGPITYSLCTLESWRKRDQSPRCMVLLSCYPKQSLGTVSELSDFHSIYCLSRVVSCTELIRLNNRSCVMSCPQIVPLDTKAEIPFSSDSNGILYRK